MNLDIKRGVLPRFFKERHEESLKIKLNHKTMSKKIVVIIIIIISLITACVFCYWLNIHSKDSAISSKTNSGVEQDGKTETNTDSKNQKIVNENVVNKINQDKNNENVYINKRFDFQIKFPQDNLAILVKKEKLDSYNPYNPIFAYYFGKNKKDITYDAGTTYGGLFTIYVYNLSQCSIGNKYSKSFCYRAEKKVSENPSWHGCYIKEDCASKSLWMRNDEYLIQIRPNFFNQEKSEAYIERCQFILT